MVEMRWYTHPSVPTGGSEFAAGVRVLQYRVYRMHRMEGTRAVPIADWSDNFGWSEWMDVPEVYAE